MQLFYETSLDYRVTLVPILLSLFTSICLDFIRTHQRNKLVSRIDNRLVKVLRDHQWVDLPIKKVCVGDIVLLHNSDFAPADIVLLSTGNKIPILIDTHIIDGSTRLRKKPPVRQVPPELMPNNICNAFFEMEYDRTFETNEPYSIVPPLAAKLKFEGKLTLIKTNTAENPDNNQNQSNNANQQEEITISLNNDQYIERYSSIYHLTDVIGAVVYTGTDSRCVQNNHENRTKFTKLEKKLNFQNFIQVLSIIVISIILSGISFFFHNTNTSWPFELKLTTGDYFLKTMIQYLVLLLPLSPLELYPMIDIVLYIHSLFMQSGNDRTYIPQVSVIDEMTQIDSVITSKSLLIDKMPSILRLYLDNEMYGICETAQQISHNFSSFNDMQGQTTGSEFISSAFQELESIAKRELLLHLSLCHSAGVVKNDQYTIYFSLVPEDEPLIYLAAQNGVELQGKAPSRMPRQHMGGNIFHISQTYKLKVGNKIVYFNDCITLPKSPMHPRISIIFRDNNVYKMYTRGALESMRGIKDLPIDAINKLQDQGLQVIVCSMLVFRNALEVGKFLESLEKDENGNPINPEKTFENMSNLEMSGHCLALIGFEEHPRDGALMFINRAKTAGMQLVLSSHTRAQSLVITGLSLGILDTKEKVGIIPQIDQCTDIENAIGAIIEENNGIDVFIVPGNSIDYLFHSPKVREIAEVIGKAKTVIIECADPNQTSHFVEFIRKYCNKTVMGIGHSVTDSIFLQHTNISVSIGVDPVSPCDITSDFIVDKLDHLINIVFIQGGWLRDRMFSLMNYIFPRNTTFAFIQVVYGFYAALSGTPIFSETQVLLILLIFTTIPALSRAIFNQKVQETLLRTSPEFYNKSRVARLSLKRYAITMVLSLVAAIFIVVFSALVVKNVRSPFNDTISLYQFSYSLSGAFVLGCTGFLIPQCDSWHWINHILIWGPTALFFVFYNIETEELGAGKTKGVASTMSSSKISTLLVFLFTFLSVFIQYTYSLFKRLIENIKNPQIKRKAISTDEQNLNQSLTESQPGNIDISPSINYQYIKEVSFIYQKQPSFNDPQPN